MVACARMGAVLTGKMTGDGAVLIDCASVITLIELSVITLDAISVLVARGRAQVGVHAAKSDWSKRIRDFQLSVHGLYDDHATHH